MRGKKLIGSLQGSMESNSYPDIIGTERRFDLVWLGEEVFTIHCPLETGESKGTVLMLHGLGDHMGRYAWAVELFHRRGYDVVGIDWPGCGKSSGIRGDLPSPENAARLVKEVLEDYEIAPIGVLAHSTGGFYLNQFLAGKMRALSDLKWVWYSSPLLDPSHGQHPIKIAAARVAARWLPQATLSTGVSSRDCYHIGDQPERAKSAEGVHDRISLQFGIELLDPEKRADKIAGKIDANLAILLSQGSEDHICPPSISERFVGDLKAEDKTYLLVSGGRHEPFHETMMPGFFNQVETWVAGR